MLFAQGRGTALALACTVPWRNASAGFVGNSDGWQVLARHGDLDPSWTRAENGNVALTGEIDFSQAEDVTLALGFGASPEEAAHRVRSSLNYGFASASRDYIAGWRRVPRKRTSADTPAGRHYRPLSDQRRGHALARTLRLRRRHYCEPVDSLGLFQRRRRPWRLPLGLAARSRRDSWRLDRRGAAAAGARRLAYLAAVQEADGHWPQNMWLDGTPYWGGVQLDECAFPILVLDLLLREKMLDAADADRFTEMVAKAAGFIVRNGPVTRQDRWEEDAGYSPFSLGVTVAALLAAAISWSRAGFRNGPSSTCAKPPIGSTTASKTGPMREAAGSPAKAVSTVITCVSGRSI